MAVGSGHVYDVTDGREALVQGLTMWRDKDVRKSNDAADGKGQEEQGPATHRNCVHPPLN
jgi:hypothetical protein